MPPPAPNRIHQTLARHVQARMKLNCTTVEVKRSGARQSTQVPLVLAALQRHPPPPLPPRATIPTSSLAAPHDWEVVSSKKARPMVRSHAKRHLRPRTPRPEEIIYPEDKWRSRFYREHPLELRRLQTLEEDGSTFQGTWTSIQPAGCYELTGENVVQYQQWLIHVEGLSSIEAYAKAVREFHLLRARRDTSQRLMVESLRAQGRPVRIRSMIEQQLRDEDKALFQGEEAMSRKLERMRGP
ncbi:mitochondrial ribosomal protein S25-domain-containing protein [Piptocephalis cylindrospora]|uniref:Small ribosomal subunit protein mS23 n=1 Tax=Piptocephalis cylindrospora TaxID=1907219 RepID=A0A4V1IYJ2_9FUNG|nr:mitochondrial ribosomal protein S25-domain-containing protein [Piptocephalis cylindrospora]|eukprot:RKP14749.1 mitochondrial ribosomal protein S25-domain-containing protein [Piptocephalis cylindrospora]